MWWKLGAAANGTIALAYLAIAAAIVLPLVRTRQLGANRLGTATACIFFTCAVHHGAHTVHLLLPALGLEQGTGRALRQAFDWHTVAWDFVGAGVAVYYWSLRRTYGALMRGATLFEDLKERERQALELNDDIVQGLVAAEMALRLDERELSADAIQRTLEKARAIITTLLGEAANESQLGPGDLVRARAAAIAE
jgi:signal transduction histidine kinase